MNQNIKKFSIFFVFATLFLLTVSGAQAAESIWFSGQGLYQPATHVLNGGSCYSATNNSENIYLATNANLTHEAMGGTCSLTDGRSFNIWFPADSL